MKADFFENNVTEQINQFIDLFDTPKEIQNNLNFVKNKISKIIDKSYIITNKFHDNEITNNEYHELITPLNEQLINFINTSGLLEEKISHFRHLRGIIKKYHNKKSDKLGDIDKELLCALIKNIIVDEEKIRITFATDILLK